MWAPRQTRRDRRILLYGRYCALSPYRSAQRQLGEVLLTGSCCHDSERRVTVKRHLAEHRSKRRQSAGRHAAEKGTNVATKGGAKWLSCGARWRGG